MNLSHVDNQGIVSDHRWVVVQVSVQQDIRNVILRDTRLLCIGYEFSIEIYYYVMFHSIESSWILVLSSIGLITLSGICAGLTLGLLSLDVNDLEILKRSSNESDARAVAKVEPLIRKPHVLLVSLLLINSACMEALPLLLDRLLDPASAIIISVTVILLFGEILPQALCKKYGIQVGASLAWLVKLMIFVTYPLSFPISRVLDYALGHTDHALFRRAEIQALVEAQSEMEAPDSSLFISREEAEIVDGALRLYEKSIVDCITPMSSVYSISINDVYSEELELSILESGHSRVPVKMSRGSYKCLLVKELLILPKDCVRKNQKIRDLQEINGLLRDMPVFQASDKKIACLHAMIECMRHMALVVRDTAPSISLADIENQDNIREPLIRSSSEKEWEGMEQELLGIVTLEDILEDVISREIIDETDRFRTNTLKELVVDPQQIKVKEQLIESRRRSVAEKTLTI
jgi:metal transporter CNNM